MVLQPCSNALKGVVLIYPLQSVDFVKVFHSVIIFLLPLVAAALVLYHSVVWLIML